MAPRRYEIPLRVLRLKYFQEAQRRSEIFSTFEEKFRISKHSCNVLFTIAAPMKYKTISLFFCKVFRRSRTKARFIM